MCVFCKIVSGEIPAEPVAKDLSGVIIADRNPQAKVHMLAISSVHAPDVSYSASAVFLLRLAVEWASKNLPNGYRIVTNVGEDGGQVVKHLHFHILGGEKLKDL